MPSSPLKTIVIAALLGASFTGAAFARDTVVTARLAAPVAERTQVIANNQVWTCEGDTCRAIAHTTVSVHDCRLFVRQGGAVVAFGPEASPLSAEAVARCNGAAPTVTAQAHN